MDQFMNEMAVWNGMSSAFIFNAIFFAACAFLIWVGFRFTSRIYYEGNVNLLGKIFTTLFCLINNCIWVKPSFPYNLFQLPIVSRG